MPPSAVKKKIADQSGLDTHGDHIEPTKQNKLTTVLAGAGLIFSVGFYYIVMLGFVRVYPTTMSPAGLQGFSLRLEYALRYQSLQLLWLSFNVCIIMFWRFKSNSLDPDDGKLEPRLRALKNILTNSLESTVISVLAQLIFISYSDTVTILRFIPFVNILQFIGRIAFFAGYPTKRAFGFACTMLPNTYMTLYNVYHFGSFMERY